MESPASYEMSQCSCCRELEQGYTTPDRMTDLPTTPPRLTRQRAVLVDNYPLVLNALCINSVPLGFCNDIRFLIETLNASLDINNTDRLLHLAEIYRSRYEQYYEHINYTVRFMDVILSLIMENNEDVIHYYSDLVTDYMAVNMTDGANQGINRFAMPYLPVNDIDYHAQYLAILEKVRIISDIAADLVRHGNSDFLFIPDFPRYGTRGGNIPEIITTVFPVEELLDLYRCSVEFAETTV